MAKQLFCITYIDEEEKEQYIEVPAYSEKQARSFILGIDEDKIVNVECTVKKYATY